MGINFSNPFFNDHCRYFNLSYDCYHEQQLQTQNHQVRISYLQVLLKEVVLKITQNLRKNYRVDTIPRKYKLMVTLREKCPYSLLLRNISSSSVRMRENADLNNSKYGHFLRSVISSNILR